MKDSNIHAQLRELDHLYAQHAKNQNDESLVVKNKLHKVLSDKFTSLKVHIKKHTLFQWYEPVYTYAICGNREYIDAVRKDLAQIINLHEKQEVTRT